MVKLLLKIVNILEYRYVKLTREIVAHKIGLNSNMKTEIAHVYCDNCLTLDKPVPVLPVLAICYIEIPVLEASLASTLRAYKHKI